MTMLPDRKQWAVVLDADDEGKAGPVFTFSSKEFAEQMLHSCKTEIPSYQWRLGRFRIMEIGLVDPKPTTIKPKIRGVEEPCFNQASLTEPDEIDECWAPDCGAKCDWENCYDGRESPMYKCYDAWTRGEELGEGPDENKGGEVEE